MKKSVEPLWTTKWLADPLNQTPFVYKRLLTCGIYMFINEMIKWDKVNYDRIRSFIECFFEIKADEILIYFSKDENKPSQFEKILFYNQVQADQRYIQNKISARTVIPSRYIQLKPQAILTLQPMNLLSDKVLITCLSKFKNCKLLKWDFEIFLTKMIIC